MDNVWIVSYFDSSDSEATVAAFGDEDAAIQYFKYLKKNREHVAIDKTPVYNKFIEEC